MGDRPRGHRRAYPETGRELGQWGVARTGAATPAPAPAYPTVPEGGWLMMPPHGPAWSSSDAPASPAESIRLRHVVCVRCSRHVAATQFLTGGRVSDSWGGVFFDHPGFVCDCCLNECPTCRGGNE